jgi:hypothetical protein
LKKDIRSGDTLSALGGLGELIVRFIEAVIERGKTILNRRARGGRRRGRGRGRGNK